MKLRYIIASALAVFALASCEKENFPYEKGETDATEGKSEVFFLNSGTSKTVELDPSATDITVTIDRASGTGSLIVPLVVKWNQGGAFEIPESVTFADGQTSADITIGVSKLDVGKEYTVEIAVPTDYYYIYKDLTAGAPSYKTTVQKLSWVKVATGTYTSALFGDITDVELEKCESVEGRYRFKNLFAEGTDIVFNTTGSAQKDDDGKEYYALTVAMQRTGYSNEDGTVVVADVSTAVSNTDYLEYNYIYPSTYEIGIYMYYLNLNAAGSLSGIGAANDTFTPNIEGE